MKTKTRKRETGESLRNKIPLLGDSKNPLGVRGTGFLRIREAMKKWNMPPPGFREKMDSFVIRFVNPLVHKIPEIDESGLNERQKKAVEYVIKEGKITNREYRKMFAITDRTALRDLAAICEKGIFQKIGVTGRETRYILTRHKPDINPTEAQKQKMKLSKERKVGR